MTPTNTDDQVLFIEALFLLTVFDCAGHYTHVRNQLSCVEIAEAFAHVRRVFECSDPGEFDNIRSGTFIRQHRLDSPKGIMEYITNREHGQYYFPYSIDLHLADDKICGGLGYLSAMEEHHIHVPRFTAAETRMFLQSYADSIPESFHDDLAVLVLELRLNVWYRTTRPATVCCLPNGMEAMTKLTREYNGWKRAAAGRQIVDAPRHQFPILDTYTEGKSQGPWMAAFEFLTKVMEDVTEHKTDEQSRHSWVDDLVHRLDSVVLDGEYESRRQEVREAEALAKRNTAITEYMDKLRASQAATPHKKSEVQAIRQAVERRLREHYHNYSIEVHLFGSFASGLCGMSSDADMTVYNLQVYSPSCPPIVELANVLRQIGYQRVTSIPHARVPIATWKLYGIQCDANLNQPMGVHNSKLISAYSNIDDRFKTLWFSIKQISKHHGIISASTGFLSSYALVMMLIVFLQDVTSPAILPLLQQSPLATIHTIEGYDCSFDSDTIYTNYGARNTHSAGQLLVDFFYFYGHVFDYVKQEVYPSFGKIQDRSITPPPRSRTDSRPKEWPICIVDPFITDRNVAGNCGKENVAKIRACFQAACRALKENDINTAFKLALDTTSGLRSAWTSLSNRSPFPYKIPVKSRFGDKRGIYDFIYLPPLSSRQVNEFLQSYTESVPSEYQDEIAAAVYYLRANCWLNQKGSGGHACYLGDGSLGVAKYSKEHNDKKRQKTEQIRARDMEQQKALIQIRQLQEEEERKEEVRQEKARKEAAEAVERDELELENDGWVTRGMSILDDHFAELQRIQERADEVRFRSINQYLDQLKLLAATAGTRRNVEALRQDLEKILRHHHHQPHAEVCLFGSFESGLSTLTSDADFTVLNFKDLGREPIHELACNLHTSGWGPIKTIATARVPIVSFTGHGIRCDMSINQPMGVFNSQLIHAYQKIDPRFLAIWFGLRTLADKHGILDGSTGYLSSYALTMMLIVFLQDITSPPILPRLQQQSADMMVSRTIDGYHCAFDKEPRNYTALATKNIKPAGQLLTEFCMYFGHTFNYATREVNPCLGVVRNRSVSPPQRSRRDSRPKDWRMLVLDPFITSRNVTGNCRSTQIADIQKCFRSAYNAIMKGKTDKAFKKR
ncbi:hypothetical protein BGZ96_010881 [Linnemannia gamsii]|uniref:polynucleotide adenylyltransferase n=1 Tax=Linnemannia gamsii TaxID=64522 RepID=A0ABQ7JUE5_9FUNG|nr:hypothetical protein BGZ96_010881 [Linnemannia gamsii]